tara:strand:+ start:105 stop:779 length:675 start_codon:yes stop_codon:yes gene_type:complete
LATITVPAPPASVAPGDSYVIPFANPDKTTGEFIVPPHLEPGTVVLVDKDGALFSVVSSPPKSNVHETKTSAGVVPFAAAAPVVVGAAAAGAMYNPAMGAPPSMEMNRRAGPEVPLYLAIDSLVVEGVQYYEKPAAKDGMHVQYYRNDTEYIDCKWYTLFHCACIKTMSNSSFFSILLHFIVDQIIVVLLISIVLYFFQTKKDVGTVAIVVVANVPQECKSVLI